MVLSLLLLLRRGSRFVRPAIRLEPRFTHRTAIVLLLTTAAQVATAAETTRSEPPALTTRFFTTHCLDCHNRTIRTADLALDELLASDVSSHADQWEKVSRKLTTRQMPPPDSPRPEEQDFNNANAWLTTQLDNAAASHPNPGRTETFRRLTRTEYQHAIRDLLALSIDVSTVFPADDSSHGFDNITVADLNPTLVRRYLSAAQSISRLAVGGVETSTPSATFRVRPDITQDRHLSGLPLGTRGGTLIPFTFPQDGTYEIRVLLMRDRDEHVESLKEEQELEVLVDREQVARFTIAPVPKGDSDKSVDANLTARIDVSAGSHDVAVTFQQQASSLLESRRQPLEVHYNFYRHPRIGPAVYQLSITGPFEARGPGETPSRRRIFVCRPSGPDDDEQCARQILANLLRRAYRRPITKDDFTKPLEFYRAGRAVGGFDAGIEQALSAVLVSPHFLFRVELDPAGIPASTAYQVSDVELASRLSFFLWSSLPDDELLNLAIAGQLRQPDVLDQQVRRMLADERSKSLVTNFADQWLHLRNLESVNPDGRLYQDFDDNLRQSFRQETELLFASVMRDDRSVLDLLRPGATHVDERLAKYYGIPHVYGSRFRQVPLAADFQRGGLLRHGSILSVTSYATRTSPVIRGKWVLENFLGTPPPPPPPDVPALEDNTVSAMLPVRERLAVHRENAACARCHAPIDPVGFSLENFDAVGRWRTLDAGVPVDASGGLPDGSRFSGPAGLEDALLRRPELFARTLTEKLLTYALGRGVEVSDAPAVRKIVRDSATNDYRFTSLVLGIVHSTPFQMRRSP